MVLFFLLVTLRNLYTYILHAIVLTVFKTILLKFCRLKKWNKISLQNKFENLNNIQNKQFTQVSTTLHFIFQKIKIIKEKDKNWCGSSIWSLYVVSLLNNIAATKKLLYQPQAHHMWVACYVAAFFHSKLLIIKKLIKLIVCVFIISIFV